MKNRLVRLALFALLLMGVSVQVHAQTPPPAAGIRILAYGIHYGGNLVYNYKVVNDGKIRFNNFTIGSGFDNLGAYEIPQLTRLPLGWKYGREGETGVAIILAPGSTSQPAYWTSRVFGQQEADTYYLRWYAPRGPDDVSNAILPGQTLSGFRVTIPLEDKGLDLPMVTGRPVFTGPDEMYLKGNFKVGLVSGEEVWGTLEREDITPPVLTVNLSRTTIWPPNRKLFPITATITVKDDYDPAPEIQLISITANEPLNESDAKDVQLGTDDRQFQLNAVRKEGNKDGRIYTVTYSAIDGSGNKTTASATVTVPHDKREPEEHPRRKTSKEKNERRRDH